VALTVQRDVDELRQGLERWLGRAVGAIERPSPGFSCETLLVEHELVVRLPPVGDGVFAAYDLAQQAAVQDAVGAAGVAVAGPTRYEADPSFLGAPFVAMPFVEGPIPSDFTPADPWLTALASDDERAAVWRAYLDVIVAIHRTPTDGLSLRSGLGMEVEHWERYLSWATEGVPPSALVEVMAWCRANRPPADPPAGLLWGDVRLGNIVFDPERLVPRAVLDWDMASAGPIELDLAWHLALEGVQKDLTGMGVAGFGSRDEAIARVEAAVGRSLDNLFWYEVFALARASAISTRIAILHQRAGQPSMFKVGDDPTLAAALAKLS
jgi:aminoglycoside phosphotransferase (APT) family kinase protein